MTPVLIVRIAAAVWLAAISATSAAQQRALPLAELRSGFDFLGADLKAMQRDDFANPGMLWVERGQKLWSTPSGAANQSCADCHGDARSSMKGMAVRYPLVDRTTGRLMTLEGRILQCRTDRQKAPPLAWESQDFLSLSSYVAHQSLGLPIHVDIGGAARKYFEAGRELFYRRFGQMNLSCAQCHDDNWSRRLFASPVTQGHPNGYPGYRLEWQTMGSLERRLRACLSGIRADMFPYGAPEHAELALYLAWRAEGLPLEVPGVRR